MPPRKNDSIRKKRANETEDDYRDYLLTVIDEAREEIKIHKAALEEKLNELKESEREAELFSKLNDEANQKLKTLEDAPVQSAPVLVPASAHCPVKVTSSRGGLCTFCKVPDSRCRVQYKCIQCDAFLCIEGSTEILPGNVVKRDADGKIMKGDDGKPIISLGYCQIARMKVPKRNMKRTFDDLTIDQKNCWMLFHEQKIEYEKQQALAGTSGAADGPKKRKKSRTISTVDLTVDDNDDEVVT